jgi:hypothetical protein
MSQNKNDKYPFSTSFYLKKGALKDKLECYCEEHKLKISKVLRMALESFFKEVGELNMSIEEKQDEGLRWANLKEVDK